MVYPKRPWKKSYCKLPEAILNKLEEYEGIPLKVAATRYVPQEQIREGHLSPLEIHFDPAQVLHIPSEPIMPPASNGVWARRNIEGWVILRKDLPKVSRYFSVEVPNFGDYSRGTHEMGQYRECYQRELIGPLEASISTSLIENPSGGEPIQLAFSMDYVFEPHDPDFNRQLFMGINLLQETAGCADIIRADATMEDLIKQRSVSWEIFPPGTSEVEIIRRIADGSSSCSKKLIRERIELLEALHPECYIRGTNLASSAYFGAKFSDNLVVFENMRIGNAIYVMHEDWEELSKKSRIELLGNPGNYERVVHREGWEKRVRHLVNTYRDR